MPDVFGFTRTVIKSRYALITPDGFVPSRLPGWRNVVAVVNISPAMNGPRFVQSQITFDHNGGGAGSTGAIEAFIYVLDGRCSAKLGGKKFKLVAGSHVYLPPETEFQFGEAVRGTRLLIFEKRFQPVADKKGIGLIVGHERDVKARPFLGNKDARLQVLLPDQPAFDMAVNIFTYQPGATLPFVETHVMEHGLLMLRGQGIYRLDADYHPVRAGDVIWMASYCPQWFAAMGRTPASYIYFKDVNRAPSGE
ncbi:MAG TPA: (S)-ureidoglycine aminohydrolase [Verrucomicrobiae bacterium]|nr:(S)-ureidoglycine aminohydrolase [Verrucomicrobiae bacterium]